jgi:hypothetical protein
MITQSYLPTIPARILPSQFDITHLVGDWTLAACWDYVAGLSEPSKMPCYGYSTPARLCKTGSVLRNVPNSTCSKCYAFMRGRYGLTDVQDCLERRFESIDKPLWTPCMVRLIRHYSEEEFRWNDSGDVHSPEHLDKILDVCAWTPTTSHWLPSREYGIFSTVLSRRPAPANVTIRLSAHMIDGPAPVELARRLGAVTSTVATKGWDCPASTQGNQCGDCRKCWDQTVENVSYPLHEDTVPYGRSEHECLACRSDDWVILGDHGPGTVVLRCRRCGWTWVATYTLD